ncbi:MAG: hypothetical protein WCT05_15540, partial [Lentisphaeria bacterium]
MATRTITTAIKLDGEAEFKKQMSSVNSELKTLSSELKLSESEFKGQANTVEALTAKDKVLTQQIEQQKEKVKALEQAVKDASEAYGDNDKRTDSYRQQLNNAKTALNNLNGDLKNNAKYMDEAKNSTNGCASSIDEYGKEVKTAGEKTLSFGDIVKANLTSEAIIAGVKAVVNGIKDITKAAVESYAEYEQLVGGVDTLFGDSSKKVQEYADNAYKTAGMSSNDYMETVTSFSAPLLQSLGGDTDKAAEAANQALTDMSDNANKMGSDMTSIQNAYQGFAKGNYGMLDNLKLGYGGTKEEMERLLSDAEKLSGQKYDISSLSDVYDAVHAVQTEMGITGTTAKEASETISGSMDTAKAAWQNFLTGLGSGEDITGVTQNLIDSVAPVGENLLPVVGQVVESLFTALRNFIVEKLPEMAQSGADAINEFAKSVRENGISPDGETMKAVAEVLIAILTSLGTLGLALLNLGGSALAELGKGILNGLLEISDKVGGWIEENIIDPINDKFTEFTDIGKNIVSGIWEGISGAYDWICDKITGWVDNVVKWIMKKLGINSPSTVMSDKVGKYMAQGVGVGFEDEMNGVADSMAAAIPSNFEIAAQLNTNLKAPKV